MTQAKPGVAIDRWATMGHTVQDHYLPGDRPSRTWRVPLEDLTPSAGARPDTVLVNYWWAMDVHQDVVLLRGPTRGEAQPICGPDKNEVARLAGRACSCPVRVVRVPAVYVSAPPGP